jgi:hypothetical protein
VVSWGATTVADPKPENEKSPERSTSFAKTVELPGQASTIGKDLQPLARDFNSAGREVHAVAEKPPNRPTSVAKTLDLPGQAATVGKDVQPLARDFNKVVAEIPAEKSPAAQHTGKPYGPDLDLHLKPPDGPVRREVDKQIHDDKLRSLDERTRKAFETARNARGRQGLQRNRERDRGRTDD